MLFLKWISEQKGSAALFLALLMPVFLGFMALTLDVGKMYIAKQHLIDKADAAALAGVQFLPEQPDTAEDVAREYALLNGMENNDVSVSVSQDNTTIEVTVKDRVGLSFASIFNQNEVTIKADSKARVGIVGKIKGAQPFAAIKEDFCYGEIYTLKVGAGDSQQGNFRALALGGKGASTYLNNIKYGYQGYLEIGDEVDTEPGNMKGPTESGVRYRINQDPYSTFDNFPKNSPRVVYVPIVEDFNVYGRKKVKIISFGAFFLEDYNSNDEIEGRFIRLLTQGEMMEYNNEIDYGLRVVKLVKQ